MSKIPSWGGGILTEQQWLIYIQWVREHPRVTAVLYAIKHGITFEEAMESGGQRPDDPAEKAEEGPGNPS